MLFDGGSCVHLGQVARVTWVLQFSNAKSKAKDPAAAQTTWKDNIKDWTGLSINEAVQQAQKP